MTFMNQIDVWVLEHVAWWVPWALAAAAATLLAWFPGRNAAQRSYDYASRVGAVSWGTFILMLALLGLNCDPVVLPFPFALIWLGAVVWSYGDGEPLPSALRNRGFEVRLPAELYASPKLA
jgi:hypothetical protein